MFLLLLDHKLLEDKGVPSSLFTLGHLVGIPQTLGPIAVFNLLGGDALHFSNLMKKAVDSGLSPVCMCRHTHIHTSSALIFRGSQIS